MSTKKPGMTPIFSITPHPRCQPHLNKLNHLAPKIAYSPLLTVEDRSKPMTSGKLAERIELAEIERACTVEGDLVAFLRAIGWSD